MPQVVFVTVIDRTPSSISYAHTETLIHSAFPSLDFIKATLCKSLLHILSAELICRNPGLRSSCLLVRASNLSVFVTRLSDIVKVKADHRIGNCLKVTIFI
ncbi:hypothetical protein L6164_029022 [Bauhinia variegata]|uniref:Uncharacterized protein n=1 Tax=Bauhinia variegata TaxID=167791 RepID=A0ACB9L865_BAUVA|nr:hypothetical protein L6164_029022 [Bauhinia variegata]